MMPGKAGQFAKLQQGKAEGHSGSEGRDKEGRIENGAL